MAHDDDVKRDALGLPYKPRPLPPQPARSLLAGTLKTYRDSASTDIAETFARVRRELRGAKSNPLRKVAA